MGILQNNCIISDGCTKNTELDIVCFPHSGGGANAYLHWAKKLPEHISLNVICYPGREYRYLEEHNSEDFFKFCEPISSDINTFINKPTIFFGHSFGALIAHHVAANIMYNKQNHLKQVIVSACQSPSHLSERVHLSHLPNDLFITELQRIYKGIPNHILSSVELTRYFSEIIKKDYRLLEHYNVENACVINHPIFAIEYQEDSIDSSTIQSWDKWTSKKFQHTKLDGDHFTILEYPNQLLNFIVEYVYKDNF